MAAPLDENDENNSPPTTTCLQTEKLIECEDMMIKNEEGSQDIKDEDGTAGGSANANEENPEVPAAVEQEEEYLYPDMLTKQEWNYNEMIRIPNRREALI